jgi:Papain family cysteine protease
LKTASTLVYISFILLVSILAHIPIPVQAQGLLLDDVVHESLPKLPFFEEGNKAELETMKGIYKVDLKPFCPAPQDQGFIASCTGWASGYGALSILKAIEMGWEGQKDLITENALSALFIYNQIKKGSCDFGAYMSDAAILIRDKGDVLSKDFDKLKNKCDKLPNEQELKAAQAFRIKDFMTVFGSADPAGMKIQRTKLSLVQKKPVVIGLSLLKNFEGLTGGSEVWYPQIGDTTANGGHSMVVVGFDDGKEAFEVMNSWGSEWGKDGFVWIKYRDFGKYCHYGYVFIPEHEDVRFFDLVGSLTLRKPVYPDPNTLDFQEVQVQWKAGYYELRQGTSRKGDLLQPVLLEIRRDAYFYLFSVDAQNNIRVHWPRDGKLDQRFEGNHESAIITIPKVDLAIPGRYGALQLSTVGTEYWCGLISESPISKFNEYLNALRLNPTTDFSKRLKKVFGSLLLSPDRITYATDKLQAESDMTGGEIVPIILKLKIGG